MVDLEGNTVDSDQPSPLRNWTLALLQMRGFIRGMSGDDGSLLGWLFQDLSIRNKNPVIGDKIYQVNLPNISTRYSINLVHTPE